MLKLMLKGVKVTHTDARKIDQNIFNDFITKSRVI